ncbi:MAG: acylphosphatase [Rhodospirillaceae bacterium]|nr:acylphosphatase [Rhodospirillaceae bacterium]
MPDPEQMLRVVISGRVQGVWFRGWTVAQAQSLGLQGWVRNLSDGNVEAVFAGAKADVAVMQASCHQGPPAARVRSVAVEPWLGPVPAGFQQWATERC